MTNNNHPAHGPVSLERLQQISEILSKAAAQSDGGNLGYAMADAVKVINGTIAAFDAEPVAWRYRYVHTPKTEEHGSPFTTEWKLCDSEDECNPSDCFERQPLYTAPSAPLVQGEHYQHLSDLYHSQEKRLFKLAKRIKGTSFDKYAHSPSQAIDVLEAAIFGKKEDNVSVCVAAIVQDANVNSPVTPDGYVLVPNRLTAENGAKGELSGEFSETKFINCPECFGEDECETCDGSGRLEITVPVTWTTIKAIWVKGVEHFEAATQQEVKS